MEKELNRLKNTYKNTPIPEELNQRVNQSINNYQSRKEQKKMKILRKFKGMIAASLLIISSFTIGVNTSESFATTAKNIPVIASLVQLVSFESYRYESDIVDVTVNIPAVKGFESEKLTSKINKEIKEKMNTHLEAGKLRAKEYKKAYIETGGSEENFRPMKIEIDYELKSYKKDKISFGVHYFESLASSYAQTYYYTVDINKNKLLTLKNLLGENYKESINEQITAQIERALKDTPSKYFKGEMGFKTISENQKFYIDDSNQIIIVFDKYEIAPGSSGEPEFTIEY